MMHLLEAQNLSKCYNLRNYQFGKTARLEAIKNISFTLDAGQTLAIVGESGSGKSTLARQIIGIEAPTNGRVVFNGEELNYKNKKHRKLRFKNIRMIFQNPYESLNPQARVGSTLEEVLLINTQLSAKQRKRKIEETLTKVGLLPEHQYRYPYMFSGGQRQRIAIARAIILDPKIIIADEPLSALDVSIQAQILNLMQELQEQMKISYLFISHDLNVVEHIADNVMVMFHGEVVELGSIEHIYDDPQHPYTQALFASTPMYRRRFPDFAQPQFSKRKGVGEEGCCFAKRCQYCQSHCEQEAPPLLSDQNGHEIACFNVNSDQKQAS
ncbi:dipeptide ABC transporter ATP-binding protein [Aliikangiella coralliicola]|uniref:Dipeptide ABC transporter ATP-binding protein n=1 Tax=Aliikangiella coralliicola TaxID=2592383 RepID=A0A545UAX6_9GAMM|nr:dipeptide ABC transporter ATP-binding protein [Aliikangiella coralliicola]TQV86616.1 dipeptide ABC transporter ATP-binding protein [Aliikangiella coralliicola]